MKFTTVQQLETATKNNPPLEYIYIGISGNSEGRLRVHGVSTIMNRIYSFHGDDCVFFNQDTNSYLPVLADDASKEVELAKHGLKPPGKDKRK